MVVYVVKTDVVLTFRSWIRPLRSQELLDDDVRSFDTATSTLNSSVFLFQLRQCECLFCIFIYIYILFLYRGLVCFNRQSDDSPPLPGSVLPLCPLNHSHNPLYSQTPPPRSRAGRWCGFGGQHPTNAHNWLVSGYVTDTVVAFCPAIGLTVLSIIYITPPEFWPIRDKYIRRVTH